jgi:hypothetical protein
MELIPGEPRTPAAFPKGPFDFLRPDACLEKQRADDLLPYALVTRDLFIVALAIATAAAGIALLAMLIRRRRREKQMHRWAALGPPPMPTMTRRPPPPLVRARAAASASYAGEAMGQMPVATAALHEEEAPYIEEEAEEGIPFGAPGPGDIGKICPTCGSRYGSHYRVCERDNTDLAAVH